MDVLADNDALFLLLEDLLGTVGNPDALALGLVVWLHDVPLAGFLFLRVVDESRCFIRQDIRDREEVVVTRMLIFHLR